MSRYSFIWFNILLVFAVYGMIYAGGSTAQAIRYTLINFSAPYIALMVALAVFITLRWFLAPDEDMIKGAITYWHAAWVTTLLTILAVKLLSGELTIPRVPHVTIH